MEKRMQVFPGVGCLRGSRGVNIGATLGGFTGICMGIHFLTFPPVRLVHSKLEGFRFRVDRPGVSNFGMYARSLPKQGIPNIDTRILSSLLWVPRKQYH